MTRINNALGMILGAGACLGLAACENLPGTRQEQATVAAGAAGAAVGTQVTDNDLLGALIGGAVGAAGAQVVGARTDWFDEEESYRASEAEQASEEALEDPASVADVRGTDTADLNNDGFVTMDELIAMEEAGLTDDEILDRLQETDQVFELGASQREELRDAGLSRDLLAEIEEVNREVRDDLLAGSDIISAPR